MAKDVIVLTGAGQIGMAIARRIGNGKKIVLADWKIENANNSAKILTEAGFDTLAIEVDISSRKSINQLIKASLNEGEISIFINAAGVSPTQATIEEILYIDLYGTALLLEEFGKIIKQGGAGVTISSQSSHRMPCLTIEEDRLLATIPSDELLNLDLLKKENIKDTLHAYQIAKRGNIKRVMAESINWSKRGARLNSISP